MLSAVAGPATNEAAIANGTAVRGSVVSRSHVIARGPTGDPRPVEGRSRPTAEAGAGLAYPNGVGTPATCTAPSVGRP